jgi:hypothetical protein
MVRRTSYFLVLAWRWPSTPFLRLTALLFVLFALYAFVANRLQPDRPVPVHGVVTYEGQPVADAIVTFLPADDLGRRAAHGRTGPDGSLYLTTFDWGDGVLPGEYKVVVCKHRWQTPVTGELTEVAQNLGGGFLDPIRVQEIRQNYPSLLPAIYGDPSRSPLRCKVPGKDGVVFNLEGEGAP